MFAGNQDAGHALWNYEYSIDLEPGGIGSLTFNDVSVSLSITDLTTLATETANPLNGNGYVNDNTGFGTTAGTTLANRDTQVATDWSAQNSENPEFPNFLSKYNSASPDLYEFVLQATRTSNGTVLATDIMFVQVTPEPSTLILWSTGSLGLLLFRRYRPASAG